MFLGAVHLLELSVRASRQPPRAIRRTMARIQDNRLGNYTFLTTTISMRDSNVYGAYKGADLKGFSNILLLDLFHGPRQTSGPARHHLGSRCPSKRDCDARLSRCLPSRLVPDWITTLARRSE